MLSFNLPFLLAPHRAPQIHTGTTDFLPPSGTNGQAPVVPLSISSTSLAALPPQTWGAGIAIAPDPGQPGQSQELLAFWGGLPNQIPPLASDLRVPFPVRAHDRSANDAKFAGSGAFKEAIAARQQATGVAIACFESSGTRYADLKLDFGDATEGAEIRDIYRESDNTKVGEAFLYRSSASTTVQHWVMFNSERFDGVVVVRRQMGGSLQNFLNSLASRHVSGVQWPHVVEHCTHFIACPW